MKPKKRKKTATKRNPSKAKTRTKWRTRTITKTVRAKRRRNPSKKVSRKRRRNPSGKLKSFLPMLTGTVLPIGGGLVLSLFGTRYIPAIVPARARGLIPGILGTALAVFTRSNMLRNVGYGVAAGGVLDLARQNIPMLALSKHRFCRVGTFCPCSPIVCKCFPAILSTRWANLVLSTRWAISIFCKILVFGYPSI